MDVQFYGANCFTLITKQVRLIIDDNLADMGAKPIGRAGDIAIFTGPHGDAVAAPKIIIDQPGEYEVSGVSIFGIAARSHMDEADKHNVTMYKLIVDDIRVLIVGHVYPELSSAQLETIGTVDVIIIPVGGNGYTLDGIGALKVIKEVEPKLIIPSHYELKGLAYPAPQQPLAEALKAMAMEPKESVTKLKVKLSDLSETTHLIILEKA